MSTPLTILKENFDYLLLINEYTATATGYILISQLKNILSQ